MFHKPAGCITARVDDVHKTVMDYFPQEMHKSLFPVGRLDKDTTGLLIFTDDGMLNQKLMHPLHHVEKTYLLYAVGELNEADRLELESGVMLKGEEKITAPCSLEILEHMTVRDIKDKIKLSRKMEDNPYNYDRPVFLARITINEGRKHQIKRMMLYKGCRVIGLHREALGPVKLDENLLPGQYRYLTEEEISLLKG